MSHFVLELFFDTETERAVQALWDEVDALPGWTPPARDGARPHISVCSCASLRVDAFAMTLGEVTAQTPPMGVDFASVAVFPSAEGVVFLAPVVTVDLLALHSRLIGALRECGASIPDLYTPGHWVPHCTLALGLPLSLLSEAVAVALREPMPLVGSIEHVGLVEVSPTHSRMAVLCPLAGGQAQDGGAADGEFDDSTRRQGERKLRWMN